jgi:signal transduction histidine kinase
LISLVADLGMGSVSFLIKETLERTLMQVVGESQTIAPDRVIETEITVDAPILYDPPRMAQLVSNLLSNALTYGDPSEPVHVHASTGSDGLT